jgi:hypothetical protein
VRDFHGLWSQVAIWVSGLVGIWGVSIRNRERPPRVFSWAVGVAAVALLTQVVTGVIVMTAEDLDPGQQHVFYGILIAVSFAFAYIYRAQFRKRPAWYYGLLLLFTMGLGIRGMMTMGVDF